MTITDTNSKTPSLDDVTQAIARLRDDLQQHEDAAATIRTTLAELRKSLASLGKRAGTKARSGRKRAKVDRPLPLDEARPS
jgi:cell division septum initiation protein DivIVA